jgi:hypothetical protein
MSAQADLLCENSIMTGSNVEQKKPSFQSSWQPMVSVTPNRAEKFALRAAALAIHLVEQPERFYPCAL